MIITKVNRPSDPGNESRGDHANGSGAGLTFVKITPGGGGAASAAHDPALDQQEQQERQLEQESERLRQRIEALQAQIEQQKDAERDANMEVEVLTRAADEARAEAERLRQEVEAQRSEIRALQDQRDGNARQLDELHRLQELQDEALIAEMKKMRERCAALIEEAGKAAADVKMDTKQLDDLRASEFVDPLRAGQLCERYQQLNSQLSELQEALNALSVDTGKAADDRITELVENKG